MGAAAAWCAEVLLGVAMAGVVVDDPAEAVTQMLASAAMASSVRGQD